MNAISLARRESAPRDSGRPGPTLVDPPRRALWVRLAEHRPDNLAKTAWALMINTGVTSVLGMGFWAVASAVYTPKQLGASAALISAMMLLSVVSQLDLAMGITGLLPQIRSRRWYPVLAAYGAVTVSGLVVAAVFVELSPGLSSSFGFLGHSPLFAASFIAAVAMWNIFALQDAVLTSARWSAVVPLENGLFGVLKIGLILALTHSFGGQGIYFGWVLAMALILPPVNSLIFGRLLRPRGPQPEPQQVSIVAIADRAGVARFLALDYAAGLLNQGYTAVLPLLVLPVLDQASNAYFYIVLMVTLAVRAIAQSMSTSLVVEGAHDESDVGAMARISLLRYAKYALPPIVVFTVFAKLLLVPFGPTYVAHGTTLLRLFLVATIPHAVIVLYFGVERVRARVNRVLAVEAITVVLVILGTEVGMHRFGLVGVGLAWLGAHTLVAALIAPALFRACRRQEDGATLEA